jgi:hypothetical protein
MPFADLFLPLALEPHSIALLALAALGAMALAILRLRARRCRKWELILEEPASSVAFLKRTQRKGRPPWIMDLPDGLELDSEEPLFEVLYAHFRTHPATFRSQVLSLAIARVDGRGEGKDAKNALPEAAAGETVSTEEKIKTLLGAKADPADLVPTDALTENVVLNLVNVLKGKKKLSLGLEHALLDSLGAAGGIAGSKVGGAVGLASASLLAGVSLPLVPAFAFAGALLGALAGKRAGAWFKGWRYFAALRQMQRASRRFKKWFLDQFPEFIEARDKDFETAIAQTQECYRRRQSRFMRFWYPDLLSAFFRMSLHRLDHDREAERKRLERLRATVRSLDPLEFAAVLGGLDEKSASSHPQLLEHYEAYRAALQALRNVRDAAGGISSTQKSA